VLPLLSEPNFASFRLPNLCIGLFVTAAKYYGCMRDKPNRLLSRFAISSGMTLQKCLEHCTSKVSGPYQSTYSFSHNLSINQYLTTRMSTKSMLSKPRLLVYIRRGVDLRQVCSRSQKHCWKPPSIRLKHVESKQ
jgi:hypothetical protein